jgi:hypothetical protein
VVLLIGACVLLGVGLAPGGGDGPAGKARPEPIYRFDARADDLLRELFPRQVAIAGVTHAYLERGKRPRFDDLDAVYDYHSRSMDLAKKEPATWVVGDDVLDSALLAAGRAGAWQGPLLRRAGRVAELATALARSERPFRSPLEKALLQRDVVQMCLVLNRAVAAADSPEARRAGQRALEELTSLWRRLLLTEGEHAALVKQRPRQVPSRLTPVSRFDLAQDYLPARVLGDEPGWFPMVAAERATLHFRDFAGRSFIRIFIKPAGLTREQFERYWDKIARAYGERVTRLGGAPPLPARTETLLVRTFGVFLEDGSYADSGYPEEVLMRLFKHADTQLDLATSDYRGTLLYRYRMHRRALLADVASLGLRRVPDDEPQFFGLFSDVPDHRRAYSATVTTLRNNCIGCHSELFYGAGTVFSLGLKRAPGDDPELSEEGLLERTAQRGRFRLRTPEFLAWQRSVSK